MRAAQGSRREQPTIPRLYAEASSDADAHRLLRPWTLDLHLGLISLPAVGRRASTLEIQHNISMKKTLVFAIVGIFSASALLAADDAKAEVKAAAKKLGDKSNYSWTSTPKVEGGGGGGNF